jgi:hypothetical protein
MEYLSKVRGFQNFIGEPPPDKIFGRWLSENSFSYAFVSERDFLNG